MMIIPPQDFFYLLNSMIFDLKRSIDLICLFDPVLYSSLDDLVIIHDDCDGYQHHHGGKDCNDHYTWCVLAANIPRT